MKLYLGNRNYSSWSLRGWLAAKLSGLALDVVQLSLSGGSPNAGIRAVSPSGLVPCLHDGDVVVWDSLAIAETLAERVPAMWPSDAIARAHARSATAEMHAGFATLRSGMTMCIRERVDVRPWSPALARDIARIEEIFGDARTHFGSGGRYLYGPFSIADCFYAPVAFRFQTYGVALAGVAGEYVSELLAHPYLREWERDALAETEVIEVDEPRIVYRDLLARGR